MNSPLSTPARGLLPRAPILSAAALLLLHTAVLRAATFTVNTTMDEFDTPSGTNVSLREALRDAAATAGADTVVFAPALSGLTIVLGNEIAINDPGAVIVDASGLPSRVVIDGGPGNNRIFHIGGNSNVSMAAINLTGGNGLGAVDSNAGGAAYLNGGSLTLTSCTLSSNSAGAGGAIYNNYATLVLDRCSLSGNSSVNGGALVSTGSINAQRCSFTGNTCTGDGGVLFSSDGSVGLGQCTLQGNTASNDGGAIKSFSQLDLTHCTITGNNAGGILGGGAIYHVRHYLTVTNSIIAGNTLSGTGFGADIRFDYQVNVCTLTRVGANIIQSLGVGGTGGNPAGPAHIIASPLLAPLADYGGPTKTMALQTGSPARNAATVLNSPIITDQRGFSIVGAPDIGAYEAGTRDLSYTAFIWENLPPGTPAPQHEPAFDFDGDGVSNHGEWIMGSDVAGAVLGTAAGAVSTLTPLSTLGSLVTAAITRRYDNRTYTLEQSDTLFPGSWIAVPGLNPIFGAGGSGSWSFPIPADDARFYRLRVTKD